MEAVEDTRPAKRGPRLRAAGAAHEPYATYSNALVAGVAVMRRLFGPDPAERPGSL
jgi:hypothetical protein